MKIILFIILSFASFNFAGAQQTLKGKVTDMKGNAIPGANVYIKNTYSGTTTDTAGNFTLNYNESNVDTLVAKYIGYNTFEKIVGTISNTAKLNIKLTESINNINAVVITAGAFEASDEKKSATMTSLDIVTTASGEADLYGAYNTMPGTQKVGEKGGLFVRGGDGYETKTFIDGMLVQNPYSASMPNLPSRSRFSPFLFGETVFSTGGYSAEYGQVLSSILLLNTKGIANQDKTEITLLSVGAGVSHTNVRNDASLSLSFDYQNLAPYYNIIKQDVDWKKPPESYNGNLIFKQKTGKTGMLKTFVSGTASESRLAYHNYEVGTKQLINLNIKNAYVNTVYTDMFSPHLKMKLGIAFNTNFDDIDLNKNNVKTKENLWQSKLDFKYFLNEHIDIKFGSEVFASDYNQNYFEAQLNNIFNSNFKNTIYASFAETELKLTSKFAARIGGRCEYSTISKNGNMSPRVSLALKTGTFSQFSVAYGTFFQTAQNDFLKFNHNLKPEKAVHYIANWQYAAHNRTFRLEAYYKNYKDLVKYTILNSPIKSSYNNKGYGYAQGLDVFWQDKKTFRKTVYRISYSYSDTQRDYLNYKDAAAPIFSSKHNFVCVYNRWLEKLTTYIGFTYSYSSGRPYYNPNNSVFLSDRTKAINDLSCNASYLTEWFGSSIVIHFSVNNILGSDKIYGYRYDIKPNDNNYYEGYPIKPAAKRFAVIAIIIKFNK
ncbi:MAG: TonB-dependent receptor [Chlorobi bacterium]|nr:TonB-dependent receptor [Chlorobiota bacterium]